MFIKAALSHMKPADNFTPLSVIKVKILSSHLRVDVPNYILLLSFQNNLLWIYLSHACYMLNYLALLKLINLIMREGIWERGASENIHT
jgi:hypothetical protein